MSIKKGYFPECEKEQCFANVCGHCRALDDTEFFGRECPFFKTKKLYKEELAKHPIMYGGK